MIKYEFEVLSYDENDDTFRVKMSDGIWANCLLTIDAEAFKVLVRKFGEPDEFVEEREFEIEV